jgi:hypothetical protein
MVAMGIHTNFDTSLVAHIGKRTQRITRVVTAELLDLGLRVLGLADGLDVGGIFVLAVILLASRAFSLRVIRAGDIGVVWACTHLIAPNKQPGIAAEESFAIATNARKKVALENILICRSSSNSRVFVCAVGEVCKVGKRLVSRIQVKQLNRGRRRSKKW